MKARIVKVIIGWNAFLTLLLILSAAANANLAQAAKEPPMQVFSSSTAVNGGAMDLNAADVLIEHEYYTTVAEVTVTLPAAKPHLCVASASAEAEHQSGIGRYTITLRRDGDILLSSSRHFELINNPGIEDPKYKEVSTTGAWTELTGVTLIRFQARKSAPETPNMKVTNAALSVVCFRKLLNE